MRHITWGLLLISSIALGHDDSRLFGDSGITGPPYAEILKMQENLKAQYPELVTIIDYGKTVKGKQMRMMVVKRNLSIPQRPAMLIDGTIHGNEYLNIEDRAPGTILERANTTGPVKTFLDKGGVFLFVPIINPDGYVADQRANANGLDLNRDWDVPSAGHHKLTQPESKLLAQTIRAMEDSGEIKLKLNIDYHCCAGAALHPLSYTSKPMNSADLKNHYRFTDLAKKFINSRVGTAASILGYLALGTTNDYFYEKHNAISITYEGDYGVEDERYPEHVQWWEAMLGLI